MRRRILLIIAAIGLAYFYMWVLVYGIGVAAALAVPTWWAGSFSTRHSASLSWVLISHLLAVLLVSLPFAWVINRAYGRFAVAVSLTISLLTWGLFEAPLLLGVAGRAFPPWIWFVDAVQLIASLPVLVLLFRRLPSNNRLERSRVGAASVSQGGGR